MTNTKIIIAGIGAVGGFFGGKLAAHYAQAPGAEIFFLARGENETKIREEGLRLETTQGELLARPARISSDPAALGPADLIILCTKSYDLEQSIEQLKPCIGAETILLPLLNGVNNRERILKLLPENEVWDGCVFIVSRLAEPGLIRETGNISKLLFGHPQKPGSAELAQVEKLFKQAGVDALHSDNILNSIWKKFSFISPVATLTSYLDTSIGNIYHHPENLKLLRSLMGELKALASASNIQLPPDIVERNIELLASLPDDSTSSMHTDYLKGKTTEVESLTGYVVKLGRELRVSTPSYEMMYRELLNKSLSSNQ